MAAPTILRYPLKVPVEGDLLDSSDAPTGRVDYLKIQRFRIAHENSEGGYGGSNLPGNSQKTIPEKKVVYLAMPQSISVSYQSDYNAVNMGIAGVLGAGVAAAIGGGSDADQLTAQVQSAASAALPEIAYNKGASIISSVSSVLGMETGVNGAALQNLVKGRIMNPFTEQIFNGVQFRNHQFTIKMFARNKTEAQGILEIIKYLKMGAMPILGNANPEEEDQLQAAQAQTSDDASEETPSTTAKATQTKPLVNTKGKFLKIPDRFQLQFLRYDPGTGKLSNAEHYKFHPCVCTNVSVNYTPDGQYVSFKDAIAALDSTSDKPNSQILVPAVEVGLSFAETRFVTQADIAAGY